jgi:hypothetical protein
VKTIDLSLSKIRTDGGTQTRTGINQEAIDEYAAAYRRGEKLPPVEVFHDKRAGSYWLGDGFHRVYAAKEARLRVIAAVIHEGTQRDARLFAAGANRTHGLKRTNDDKRKAVSSLLLDAEWVTWSNQKIAEHCGVSGQMVANLRAELERAGKVKPAAKRLGKDGRETASTSNGCKSKAPTSGNDTVAAPRQPAPRTTHEGAQEAAADDVPELRVDGGEGEKTAEPAAPSRSPDRLPPAPAPGTFKPDVEAALERIRNATPEQTAAALADPSPMTAAAKRNAEGKPAAAPAALVDAQGLAVPEQLQRAWTIMAHAEAASRLLIAAQGEWAQLEVKARQLAAELAVNGVESDPERLLAACAAAGLPMGEVMRLSERFASQGADTVQDLGRQVRQLVPHTVCACGGVGCHRCGGLGWTSRAGAKERAHDAADDVPQEMRS